MELAFLIGGILIGACLVLTVRNTLKLRPKPLKVEEPSDEQKRLDAEYNAMMNYRGRTND